MEALLDLVIVLFIPLMAYRGYRRGAVVSVCSFLTVIVAFVGATVLSNNLCDSVGRLLQPVIKEVIVEELESRLQFENILVEAPPEVITNNPITVPEDAQVQKQEYVTMTRALSILEASVAMEKIEGFIVMAKETLIRYEDQYVGSVADIISTVLGREIARVGIFIISFLFLSAMWLLFSRILVALFKFPGLAEINGIVGGSMGFLSGVLLVCVFAWATGGTVIPWDGVNKTMLYEFFVKNTPLNGLASAYSVPFDL